MRSERGTLLIFYVWMIELTGVAIGVIKCRLHHVRNHLPTTLVGWVPASAMVVMAVAELGSDPADLRHLSQEQACAMPGDYRRSGLEPIRLSKIGRSASNAS